MNQEITLVFDNPEHVKKLSDWSHDDSDEFSISHQEHLMFCVEMWERSKEPVKLEFTGRDRDTMNIYLQKKPYYMTPEQYVLCAMRYVDCVKNTPHDLFKQTDYEQAYRKSKENVGIPF